MLKRLDVFAIICSYPSVSKNENESVPDLLVYTFNFKQNTRDERSYNDVY